MRAGERVANVRYGAAGEKRLDLYSCQLTKVAEATGVLASIDNMDGVDVGTSVLKRLADYVMAAALAAGYDVRPGKRTGDKKRLADAAGMDPGQLSRLLSAERMPDARHFAPLARALHVPLTELLVQSGIIPAESLTQEHLRSVSSTPIAPDTVAESWGIEDEAGRELVRAMYERLARRRLKADDSGQDGGSEAQA